MTLRARHGSDGQPVVLLHGHPRTQTTWHRVAPQLAGSFLVVCADLRGCGRSTLPADAPEHAQSSKRATAGDVVSLMRHLGHQQFAAGHDRGSLVVFRAAMDHPRAVTRLVVMDGLPVVEHLERLNEMFVRTRWHSSVVWADCDTSTSVAALASFEPSPSMVVASGSDQHLHAYWFGRSRSSSAGSST